MGNITKKRDDKKKRNSDLSNLAVLNSRIKLIRNLKGFSFVSSLISKQRKEIEDIVIEILKDNSSFDSSLIISDNILEREKDFYKNNFFINEDFFSTNSKFIFLKNLNTIILLNNREHIEIISITNGFSFKSIFKNVFKIENFIANNVEFMASIKYGYLTSQLKNCGLGLTLSTLLHLPGIILNQKKDAIFSDLIYRGYKIEPFYLNYFVLSSNINLGVTEEKLLERFEEGIKILLDIEKKELLDFYNKYKENSDDIIFRSYGLLKYIKKISYEESLKNISNILIGLSVNKLYFKKVVDIPSILNNIKDSNIINSKVNEEKDLDIIRANTIRKFINVIGEESNV